MASVQPAPGFPAASHGPGPNTKEKIQELFLKYQQMKSSGVAETDPDFIKTRNMVQNIQRQAAAQKKRMGMAHQQQQQQQAQSQQQNGSLTNGTSNGVAPVATSTASTTNDASGASKTPVTPQSATQGSLFQGGDDKHPVPNAYTQVFTPKSLSTLRSQVAAFRLLSKNLPVPAQLQQTLFPSQQAKKPQSPAESVSAAKKVLSASSGSVIKGAESTTGSVSKDVESTNGARYLDFESPYKLSGSDPISYWDHQYRDKRPLVPSIMGPGVDVDRLVEERENIVYNRIQARKSELEKLGANIGSWDSHRSATPKDDGKSKLKALIEFKKLNLLPLQRRLRQQISAEMLHAHNLAMTANRGMCRRIKKQSSREARITEKLEKQQRDARETKEKKKHNDFLRAIVAHAEEVRENAARHRARTVKLGQLMLATHQNIKKEEEKRIERTAKQRLQALRANDEETYLKLLGQAKDSRISHLLRQTDSFLKQLAASVKRQQRGAKEDYVVSEDEEEESELSETEDHEARGRQIDYYEVAHRVKEDVKQQSGNLVGGTLKDYQLKGLQWMISLYNNNLNGILADEMGLGKTIQTISLITYLIEKKNQPGPFLVIVPLSTLTNWNNEFEKWAPSVQRIVYKGPPLARKQQQQQIRYGQFQVLLTTYEFIIKDRPILAKIKWMHMIVDEGHRMKNANSKLSSTITNYYSTKYRIILTGTPLQNNLTELWAMLNFVLPNIFKSAKSFDDWFNTPFANTGGQDRIELTEEEQLLVIRRLHKVLRPFLLRRLKKDVEKDLPNKQERVIKCNFSALQAKLYKQLVTHNRLMVSDGKGGKTGVRGLSNMLMQLRKLCNHPFVFEEVEDQVNPTRQSNDLLWRTAGKFELLDRILPKFQKTGHRVLMFFQMTQIMNIMEDFMRLRGYQYLRLDGSTKSEDRSELLHQFNAPDSPYFCFLLSTRAGGLGLNLQTADTVIIYDSDWNPHQDLQAQDRAHRIGQKNEVRILRLITSNSVEEKILERANFKLDMDGKIIQAGRFDNKSTNEERDAMLRIMLESAEAAESLEQEEMDDDDLNLLMMRSDDELPIFQQIDAERNKSGIYGPDKKLPRLLGENELPEIYLNEDVPIQEEVEEITGRGARERTRVKYDDGLTEEQWLEAVDDDEDTIEAAVARKEARIAKRVSNKEKRGQGSQLGTDSPAPSRESSEEPVLPKKRGRKPKSEKRKVDDASLDGDVPQPPKKRGRQAKPAETLSKPQREALQDIVNAVFKVLDGLEEQSDDPEVPDRGIIDPFIDLPDKSLYPDYYRIIARPICMKMVQKRINRREYQSLREFRQDIGTLCGNCRTYNEDGSLLYQDANLIEETCIKHLKDEAAKHPEFDWGDIDEPDTDLPDGTTAPVSSVGTPLASGKG
ncbi:hypothetical protein P152DRAFT_168062 [Eremomyces bilateralis CBS 781.70]|uniref:Uncharacterized protein n=1 Tax=Eremomyces bilateralis CBS 781.70 TaxID=1392243 RepID=A0A6G1FU47_9PEZI|nr:uncharacterized protein P152DRAFT_168062 [Eremomyces bilateralis CBS 781.70]KAF1809283.1 hypothetical protein P152DRAFT_168062 [Eremomyces bilateralis CBS 781.70]